MIIQNESLHIRILEENDIFLLAKWLTNPEILKYYEGRDNPFTVRKVKQKFYREADNAVRCLVEANSIPIGYIQFYEIDEEERELYGYGNSMDLIYGMDQFIGETNYWNKGMGTQLVRLMVSYLLEKGADRIVMDPQTWNERAIRCYEKCGFEKVKLLPKHEWHEGEMRDCWLIEYKPIMAKGAEYDDNDIC